MYTVHSDNIAELYRDVLQRVMSYGELTKPRGFTCKELSPISMVLKNPRKNILNDNVRKINHGFMCAEFVWMWTADDRVDWLKQFNAKIADYSDDGKIFFGAYGPRIWEQLPQVLETLKNDPWTRQAVLTLWRKNPPPTKDVPCTIMFHFMRRPIDTLNLIVYMRSNDIWLGLPYDIHNFTCIQMAVAEELGLKVGTYTQVDGSLHAYEPNFKQIKQCFESLLNTQYLETLPKFVTDQKIAYCNSYLRSKHESRPR